MTFGEKGYILHYMKNTYKVVKLAAQPRTWAILNTSTNTIVEGEFFSRHLAEEWMKIWYQGEYH